MIIKTGCDIVEIKRFVNVDKNVLDKIFHKNEIKDLKAETLAGLFAAKEGCKKVFNNLGWHDIEINKKKNGKPSLVLNTDKDIISYDLSISHDKDYAIAMVVFLIEEWKK